MNGLAGTLLIAAPKLQDVHFAQSVVLLCHHDEQGAMGLVINRLRNVSMLELLQELGIHDDIDEAQRARLAAQQVHEGGPVDPMRGFILHDADHVYESTMRVTETLHLSASRDVLTAIAAGSGPQSWLMLLGYAGWGAGQLEQELKQDDWLLAPATPQLIFHTPIQLQWQQALRAQGIDPACLSMQTGHA